MDKRRASNPAKNPHAKHCAPSQGSPHLEPDHVGDLHPVEEALDLGDPTASSDWLRGDRGEH